MIQICYSKASGVELSGTYQDMEALRQDILKFISSPATHFVAEAEIGFDPSPYDSVLHQVVIIKGQGPTNVSVANNAQLQVAGSAEHLEGMTTYLAFDSEAYPDKHTHYEYFKGCPWIAEGSEPVVFSVR